MGTTQASYATVGMPAVYLIVLLTGSSAPAWYLRAFCLCIRAPRCGETINATWLIAAGVLILFIAYRLCGRFVTERALGVDPTRTTPAQVRRTILRGTVRSRGTHASGARQATLQRLHLIQSRG